MLDTLRFVQGAVAKKDFVPALTHFKIADKRITGFNGSMAISSPIDIELTANPKAASFIKAIQTCTGVIQLYMTPSGRLTVKSGGFRAHVDCSPEDPPVVAPTGRLTPLPAGMRATLQLLEPFIAEDASRPWARGILFRGQSAFATNNVTIVEKWTGVQLSSEINIPRAAVLEIIRVGEDPVAMQVEDNSATFHFSGERWIRTQLYSTEWPDLSKILDRPGNPTPPPEGLWQALKDIAPFTDKMGKAYFDKGVVSTGATESEGGAESAVEGLAPELATCFNYEQLLALKDVAKTIDFTMYPKPCLFYGDALRGAIVGMRQTAKE